MQKPYGIHWFRRDLRIAGNGALKRSFERHQGRVLGLFCFDKKFLQRPDFSINRFQFFLNTLVGLKKELNDLGTDLLVLDVGPFEAFPELMQNLQQADLPLPSSVSWGRDYEPFAVKRDRKLEKMMSKYGIEYFHERDHLVIEPHELEKVQGEGYQVYSPFARKWLEIFKRSAVQNRVQAQRAGFRYVEKLRTGKIEKIFKLTWKGLFKGRVSYPDHLTMYCQENERRVDIEIPEAGTLAAHRQLENFAAQIDRYAEERDFPFQEGTSRLSLYLKNGSLTVPQIIFSLGLKAYKKKLSGRDTFLSELIWREFYYHILARHPRVERESFILKYRDLKWKNNKRHFQAWKDGLTGFPIVDAGMRELKTTGWMHNRVRMIVASFLTKDLLIDWRWGEKHFMEKLLDGDLAANNGGWQWAASTGCDPQPYFRIFNPWLQSKKFDPNGDYIRQFVPELSRIANKNLHQPIEGHSSYPEPIVDHSMQRNLALKLYKEEEA